MKLYFKKPICATICFVLGWSVCGQASPGDTASQSHTTIQKHKAEIALACDIAMTNILHGLQQLTNRYPPLSDVGSVTIEQGDPQNSGDKISGVNLLTYSKNTRFVEWPKPNVLQTKGRFVADAGGMRLTIHIDNVDERHRGFLNDGGDVKGYYPLISEGVIDTYWLGYFLTLNSPDSALENAVKEVVENQVQDLKNKIRNIIGIDPAVK